MEAYGQWLLRPEEFPVMITAVQTAAKKPKWKNSLTRFHPYKLPEAVGRNLTETIIACAELDELRDKISWPLPDVVRPSGLEGEADFFYHLVLAAIKSDEVLTCRQVLKSGVTMALWVGGLVVALGQYHNGDRAAISKWAQEARFETIATLRQLLEIDEK